MSELVNAVSAARRVLLPNGPSPGPDDGEPLGDEDEPALPPPRDPPSTDLRAALPGTPAAKSSSGLAQEFAMDRDDTPTKESGADRPAAAHEDVRTLEVIWDEHGERSRGVRFVRRAPDMNSPIGAISSRARRPACFRFSRIS